MKKLYSIVITSLLICGFLLSACGSPSAQFNLKLGNIKNDSSVFCYKGLDWDSSAEKTQEALNIALGEPFSSPIENEGHPTIERDVYNVENGVKLFGKLGVASYEFRDDKLISMMFAFNEEGDGLKSFGEKALKELQKLYSDDYELLDNSRGDDTKLTYVWKLPNGERTSHLQLIISQRQTESFVYIGLLCPNTTAK